MKPMKLSLEKLRGEGWLPGIVEKFIPFPPPGHRVDLFGFADIVAVKEGFTGVLAVNPTSKSSLSFHIKKYLDNKNLPVWLKTGNKFVIHAWAKQGPRGARKTWQLTEREIILEDFQNLNNK